MVKSTESTLERIGRLLAKDVPPAGEPETWPQLFKDSRTGAILLAREIGVPLEVGEPLLQGFLLGVRIAAFAGITLSMLERIAVEDRASALTTEGIE